MSGIHLAALAAALAFPLAARPQVAAWPGAPAAPSPAPLPGGPRFIRVTGEGRVSVRPDVAVLVAGVESTGKDLALVTKDAAAQMRRVMAALTQLEIAEKDIQTTRHDVRVERPWTRGRPGPITGYTVLDEIRIMVRDLAKLGPVIDRVTAAGSNALHSLAFEKEDPTPDRARALALAYAAARAKAQAIAGAAGLGLGEVLAASEVAQGPVAPIARFAVAQVENEPAGVPVSVGEMEIAGSVEVTFGVR